MIFEAHRMTPKPIFYRRMIRYAALAMGLIVFSMAIGILGYRFIAGQSWVDAFLNSAMLMGGMGPVGELKTDAAKIFAGFYALYCGLILLVAVSLLMAPILHRILLHMHLENRDRQDEERPGR